MLEPHPLVAGIVRIGAPSGEAILQKRKASKFENKFVPLKHCNSTWWSSELENILIHI